jgi:phosphoenolpyruvate carboxylase
VAKFGMARVREISAGWFFLRNLIDDVETMLARADLEIARYYDALVPLPLRRFTTDIGSEYQAACTQVLAIKDSRELLDSDPTLQRSIRLRNPYVDPMNLMQVDLLQRWRSSGREDRDLFEAVLASVGGIAQGLQSTG